MTTNVERSPGLAAVMRILTGASMLAFFTLGVGRAIDGFLARMEEGEVANRRESLKLISVIGGVVGIVFFVWVSFSAFEARAYERVTGKAMSTWDAMFLNARVTGEPKGE